MRNNVCREGAEFEEFVRVQLFLQKVDDRSDSMRLRYLYKKGAPRTADVAFANDTFWFLTDEEVEEEFRTIRAPRILITEKLHARQIMDYTEMAARHHYQLVRCRFIPTRQGEAAAMEFLMEEADDKVPEDRKAI